MFCFAELRRTPARVLLHDITPAPERRRIHSGFLGTSISVPRSGMGKKRIFQELHNNRSHVRIWMDTLVYTGCRRYMCPDYVVIIILNKKTSKLISKSRNPMSKVTSITFIY